MPPAAAKDRCVILYDLNAKNQPSLRQALIKIYTHYYLNCSKNLVNLVLVNSEKTENRLNAKRGKGHLHIKEANSNEETYDPTLIYHQIEEKSVDGANWKEALNVAVQIISEDNNKKVITYQILYLTDMNSFSGSKASSLQNIASELKERDIFLYLIGPEVCQPKSLFSFDNIFEVMSNISFEEENTNLVEAKQMGNQRCKVVIAGINYGLELFFNYKNPLEKQAWLVPLTIGTKITLSVKTSKHLEKNKGFELDPITKQSKSEIFTSVNDSTKVYQFEDVRRGISKHGKFIPIQNEEMFKVPKDRSFSLAFIMETRNLPEYMLRGPASYVVIQGDNCSPNAFQCLLAVLYETKRCLIAQRVYNVKSSPIFLALFPVPSKSWFKAVQLPFTHEIDFEYAECSTEKNVNGVSEPTEKFLDSLIVDSPNGPNALLTHNLMSSVGDKVYVNAMANKLLKERFHLEQVDYDSFCDHSSDRGDSLRNLWPSRVATKEEEEEERKMDADSDNDDEENEYF